MRVITQSSFLIFVEKLLYIKDIMMKNLLFSMLVAIPIMAQGQTVSADGTDQKFEYAIANQYDAPTLTTPLKHIKKITIEEGHMVFYDHAGSVLSRTPLHQLKTLHFAQVLTGITQPPTEPNLPELTTEDLVGAEVFTPAGIRVAGHFKQLPRGVYIVRRAGVTRKLMKW